MRFAALWTGTAQSCVNLNPPGSTFAAAYGVNGGYQVGEAFGHAALWHGSASTHVDLNPSGSTSSHANGVGGNQQVGSATVFVSGIGGRIHASLWTGSAASWIDLNPAMATDSEALGVSGSQQVGYGSIGFVGFGAQNHAGIWGGTASSWVDLHGFLPPGFNTSRASAISHDGGVIQVVGYAHNVATNQSEAILWVAPSNVALEQDIKISSGKRISGGLPEIAVADDSYLKVNALQTSSSRARMADVIVGATTLPYSVSAVTLKLESHVPIAAATGEIALKNWSTGQFVSLQTFDISNVDTLVTVPGVNATPYIRTDGRIEMRIRTIGAIQCLIDLVRIELTP